MVNFEENSSRSGSAVAISASVSPARVAPLSQKLDGSPYYAGSANMWLWLITLPI